MTILYCQQIIGKICTGSFVSVILKDGDVNNDNE